MNDPAPVDLTFPTAGLDLGDGFSQQRPDTTAVGVNVRAFEPSTDRMRGGSRPGIVRYINQQLPLGEADDGADYFGGGYWGSRYWASDF